MQTRLRYSVLLLAIITFCVCIYHHPGSTKFLAVRKRDPLDCNLRWCDRAREAATEKSRLNCTDMACRDHLSEADKLLYNQCLVRVKKLAGAEIPKDNGCHFVSGVHNAVALISFPGSGNTWIRQLLESASGICTGSTMCDMSLRFAGFTGENINSGSVLVVKTHSSVPNWIGDNKLNQTPTGFYTFDSAILIIRNPLDALVSEWNRRVANDFNIETVHLHAHTKEIEKKYFGKTCIIIASKI